MDVTVYEMKRGPDGPARFPDGVYGGYAVVFPFGENSGSAKDIEAWSLERFGPQDRANYWIDSLGGDAHGYVFIWFTNPDHAMEFKLRWV